MTDPPAQIISQTCARLYTTPGTCDMCSRFTVFAFFSSPALSILHMAYSLTSFPISAPKSPSQWNLSWWLYPMLQHPQSPFLLFVPSSVLHVFAYCCLFLQEYKLHLRRFFIWFSSQLLSTPSTVSVLWHVLDKYLQNDWIHICLSKY